MHNKQHVHVDACQRCTACATQCLSPATGATARPLTSESPADDHIAHPPMQTTPLTFPSVRELRPHSRDDKSVRRCAIITAPGAPGRDTLVGMPARAITRAALTRRESMDNLTTRLYRQRQLCWNAAIAILIHTHLPHKWHPHLVDFWVAERVVMDMYDTMKLHFDNSCLRCLPVEAGDPNRSSRQVRGACFSRIDPEPLQDPQLVCFSTEALELLGVTPEQASQA